MRRGVIASWFVALLLLGALPAAAPAAKTRLCGGRIFPRLVTATGTTCRVARRVERRFSSRCTAAYPGVTDPVPDCAMTVLGYKCTPTGDAYHPVKCRRGRKRVSFQLAE